MKKRKIYFFLVMVIAIFFILFGLFNSEFQTVWEKAKTICLECIGIG